MSRSKMQVALDGLLGRDPFYAMVIAGLHVREDPTCPTAWVDGRTLGYNPEYVDGLDLATVQGLAVHEALHVIMCHHLRRGDRDHRAFNVAADKEINSIAKSAGYRLPEGALFPDKRAGELELQPVEYYYRAPVVIDMPDFPQPLSGEGEGNGPGGNAGPGDDPAQPEPKDNGEGEGDDNGEPETAKPEPSTDPGCSGEVRDMTGPDGEPLSDDETRAAEVEIMTTVVRAFHQASKIGHAPGGIGDLISQWKHLDDDPWAILRQHVQAAAKSDYSFKRPNSRLAPMGLYLPSLNSEKLGEVVFAFDMSGSMSNHDRLIAASHAKRIVDDYAPDAITCVCCDTRVNHTRRFEVGDLWDLDLPSSGGGTAFSPVFKWVESEIEPPSLLVYFTDTECCDYPQIAPDYPVIWAAIVQGEVYRHFEPGFGEIVKLKL